jgi:hypothetical protein
MFWNHGDSYGGNQGRGAGKGNEHSQMISQRNNGDKCLAMQNERLIIRMIDEQGWILRNRIMWHKPNGMPSSVTDRFSNKYEPVYMLVKSKKYWFDLDAVRKPYSPDSEGRASRAKTLHTQTGSTITNLNKHRRFDTPPEVNALQKGHTTECNPLGKNPGDVWTIPTQPYPESHFATFPTALIEPMIKAACPAEICPMCGLARVRITDSSTTGGDDDRPNTTIAAVRGKRAGDAMHITIGWTSCNCNAGWIAGTVLDPFCGSGTVLEVCRLLNRNAIGLELNPEYEPLINERSMSHTPPLTAYTEVNI